MSSNITEKRETVSFETLRDKLPLSCYEAVVRSCQNGFQEHLMEEELDESIYERYFNAEPPKPLNEAEQKELFENLGNKFVKNHYSTDTLRSFLDREPAQKRNRNHVE